MLRRKGQNLQLVFQVQKNHRFMAEFFVGHLPILMYEVRVESVPLIFITSLLRSEVFSCPEWS